MASSDVFVTFRLVKCNVVTLCSNKNCQNKEQPKRVKIGRGRNPCSVKNGDKELRFTLHSDDEILLHHLMVSGQCTVPYPI